MCGNDGKQCETNYGKAMLLNTNFVKNFSKSNQTSTCDDNCMFDKVPTDKSFCINITYEDTLRVLIHVPRGTGGLDDLNSDIMRNIAPLIARPLFIIYQQSVFQGIFPGK